MDLQAQSDLFLLSEFIKETIYILDKESEMLLKQSEETAVSALPFLVLHQEDSPLTEPLDNQLNNILKAIKIPLNKVEKLPLAQFQEYMLQGRAFVFIFSNSVPQLFTSLEKNKTKAIYQSTQVLLSDALSDLMGDKQKKTPLWNELKRAFRL